MKVSIIIFGYCRGSDARLLFIEINVLFTIYSHTK